MRSNANFEQFHRTRPDFPRTKPNRRNPQNYPAKPNQDTSPQPGEPIIENTEDKPNYSVILLYAVAFALGLVIGLLV